jgi:uncharacterized protein (UPF0212 family)
MDFEKFLLDFLEAVGKIDFSSVWKYLLIGFGIFWFAIIWWVWFDASERTTKVWAKIASVVLVTVFNIFGLIIYLVVRPDQTIEGTYWEDLERRYMKYETSELGDCPQCGAQLYPGFVYCSNCGYELKVKCDKCDVYVDRNYKHCPFCGSQLRERAVKEKEMKTEEMAEQVQATKEEITEVVESDMTRYSKKESIVNKIGEAIIGGYKIIFGGVSKKKEKDVVNEEAPKKKDRKETGKKGKKKDKKK